LDKTNLVANVAGKAHNIQVQPRVQSLFAILLTMLVPYSQAAAPAIGMASAGGTFEINSAPVSANATLFDGTRIQNGTASSRLQLKDGTRVELSPGARATVFGKKLTLEKGLGEVKSASGYVIAAHGLRIASADSKSTARVQVGNGNVVLVAAVNGPAKVFNEAGLFITDVKPEFPVSLEADDQTGGGTAGTPGAPAAQYSGCLLKIGDRYVLIDEAANVFLEVRTSNPAYLDTLAGQHVLVDAKPIRCEKPLQGTTEVLQVKAINFRGASAECEAVKQRFLAKYPNAPNEARKQKDRCTVIEGVVILAAMGIFLGLVCCNGNAKTPVSIP
jgi:hypothetical protein